MLTKLMEVAPRVSEYLQQFVVPIFSQSKTDLRQIGSGFLIEREGINFLVSAAHVLDAVEDYSQRLCIFVEPKLLASLQGDCITTPRPKNGRIYDQIDVGVIRLRSNYLPPFESVGKRAMDFDMVAHQGDDTETDGVCYLMLGFPASKGKVDRREGVQTSAYWPILNVSAEPRDYQREKLSPSMHILMPWNKRKIYNLERKIINPSTFPGMSGCPVFVSQNKDHLADFVVAGIFIEHRKSTNLLVATRTAVAANMVETLSRK